MTATSFFVAGDRDKFYPILFQDNGWADGPCRIDISRANVHTDQSWYGSMTCSIECHSTNWGHGADYWELKAFQYRTQYIAGFTNTPRAAKFVIWLRGNTTYFYRSDQAVLLDASPLAKIVIQDTFSVLNALPTDWAGDMLDKRWPSAAPGNAGLPSGAIVAWNGALSSIPTGFALCDGQNGTPDLTGRFILGFQNGKPVTGGEEQVALTEAQMPGHSHLIYGGGDHNHGFTIHRANDLNFSTHYAGPYTVGTDDQFGAWTKQTHNGGTHSHSMEAAGGNAPHNNMPPYYMLAYIMKR